MVKLIKYEVGERVAVRSNTSTPRVGIVQKITPSGQVVVKGEVLPWECRFNADGYDRGGTAWGSWRLAKLTQEFLDEIELHKICVFINKIEWSKLNMDTMRKIYNILKGEGAGNG